MTTIMGDILAVESGTILHQVNCRGVVGGLAGALHRKYPQAFDQYFAECKANGYAMLGTSIMGKAKDDLFICHVFGQLNPGANTDMAAVNSALNDAATPLAIRPIYAPFKMGCGLGGGNWRKYLEELEEFFPEIIIIQRPEDKA